jgi:release factor glutamine methyltransferase
MGKFVGWAKARFSAVPTRGAARGPAWARPSAFAHPTPLGFLRRELAAKLERAFEAEGRGGTAALDARLLLAHALGVDAGSLALRDEDPVDAKAEALARSFIERRIAGEPVARILGTREFWGLEFLLGPDTLVPRPDTETVVEAALAFVDRGGLGDGPSTPPSAHPRESGDPGATTGSARGPGFPLAAGMSGEGEAGGLPPTLHRHAPLSLLDIGTGSGAILVALLSELPNATGVGTDISAGAIRVAKRNAERLGIAPRAEFILSAWGTAVVGGFDLVLSNPPYVRSDEIAGLPVEVGRHDPHLAFDGGADGLDAYRAIFSDLGRLLKEGGKAFLEIGLGQGDQVADLAAKHGFTALFHRDLAGIGRVAEIARVGDG